MDWPPEETVFQVSTQPTLGPPLLHTFPGFTEEPPFALAPPVPPRTWWLRWLPWAPEIVPPPILVPEPPPLTVAQIVEAPELPMFWAVRLSVLERQVALLTARVTALEVPWWQRLWTAVQRLWQHFLRS